VGLFLEVAFLSLCELVHGGFRLLRILNWFLFYASDEWACAHQFFWGVSVLSCFVVWRVFLICLGVVLLLNCFCSAREVVSGSFSSFFRCLEGFGALVLSAFLFFSDFVFFK
jgi:hypothetical protein